MALSCDAGFQNLICFLNMSWRIICFLAICFTICSCHKIKYYQDRPYKDTVTLILAHKAGGGNYAPFQEYSIDAARRSFALMDGIEVDLQISKDRTIWLSHSADLPLTGSTYNCFPEVTDRQIVELDSSNGSNSSYYRLEDIFALMAQDYPHKYISLDVKSWEPCAVSSANVLGVMNVIGDEIIRLTHKYKLQNYVMVESETASFLNFIKERSSGIDCYLTSLGDFERAMLLSLQEGYTGISFKYNFKEQLSADHIQLLRKKGLKIQLWTVDDVPTIEEAISIHPNFIQTDNLEYFESLGNQEQARLALP